MFYYKKSVKTCLETEAFLNQLTASLQATIPVTHKNTVLICLNKNQQWLNDHHDQQDFTQSEISLKIDKNFVDIVDIDNMDQKSPEMFMKRAIRNARLDLELPRMSELRFSIIPHQCP
jgi:hypothetical protein